MNPAWVTAALALGGAALAVTAWIGRGLWRIGRKVWMFLADWNGEPSSAGHPATPGVLERLSIVEGATQDILHQVSLNSGKTVKDVVTRTEAAVAEMQTHIESIARQVENLPGGRP